MLYNYRYVNHSIEGLQEYLNHLVTQVWCGARGDFAIDLLHPDLQQIVIAVADDNSVKAKLFEPIRDIYNLFKDLPDEYRLQIAEWYVANNNIEALCSNAPNIQPATYTDIALIDEDLARQLKTFCIDLWDRILALSHVCAKIGRIEDHYIAFVRENDESKCPYCGLSGIKGPYHTKREAYDHYLPKHTYPFNSVNFRNLAPICHDCNSSYKLSLDPTKHIDPITRRNTGRRRKAFYSFSAVSPNIQIALRINKGDDIDGLRPQDITLDITSPGRPDEVEAWKDVFGIEERYKAHCCSKNDGKAWLSKVVEQCENYGLTPEKMLEAEIRSAEARPWSDANFLKKPFLLACVDAQLI